MKFGEYLQLLNKYLGSDMRRADFVLYITSLFVKEPETEFEENEDENNTYNPLSGDKRKLERIYSSGDKYKLPKKDARKLRAKYDSSKFEVEMKALSPQVVKAVISDLKDKGITANKNNYYVRCAEVYLRFLDALADGNDEITDFGKNTIKNVSTIEPHVKPKVSPEVADEETQLTAKAFYKKHQEEIGLIPLCIIAEALQPLRGNIRDIYNDYSVQKEAVKKEIRKLTNNEDLVIEDNWMNKTIDYFEERVTELDLSTKPFLYDGAKYFHRAIEYHAAEKVIYSYTPVFRSHYENLRAITNDYNYVPVYYYMLEYIFDREPRVEYIPPWDGLWEAFSLRNAPEEVVTDCVCGFIIGACKTIIPSNSDAYDFIYRMADYEGLIERQEDLYYYAALCLYALYCREVR